LYRLFWQASFAPTPAAFWRRWNRPAQQFLDEYAFKPAGGLRRTVRATLITFGVSGVVHEYVFGIASGRVQGWQLGFFLLQGIAAVTTMRIKPQGRVAIPWIAGTWLFNVTSSILFFRSVDAVVPFYSVAGS
jgi:D-alanyl-lipoteichoic acid acyltransferase DltB (MBOAT superfamily)